MMRNMVTTFIDHEQIETTDAKAKEVRSLAERLVTLSKRGSDDLAARRRALRVIRDKKIVAKLFDEIGPRYADRPGGYTRIVKVETRRGDGAPLSILKFVTEPVTFKEKKARPQEEFDEVRPAEPAEPEVTETPETEEASSEEVADEPAAQEAGREEVGQAPEGEAADEPVEETETPKEG